MACYLCIFLVSFCYNKRFVSRDYLWLKKQISCFKFLNRDTKSHECFLKQGTTVCSLNRLAIRSVGLRHIYVWIMLVRKAVILVPMDQIWQFEKVSWHFSSTSSIRKLKMRQMAIFGRILKLYLRFCDLTLKTA